MKSKVSKSQAKGCGRKCKEEAGAVSYRLKCAKTANGLSHYVMYGDVDGKSALL